MSTCILLEVFWHNCSKFDVRLQLIAMLRLHYLSHGSFVLCKLFIYMSHTLQANFVIKVHSWIGLQHSAKAEN